MKDGGAEIDTARQRDVEGLLSELAERITTVHLTCNIDGAELFVDDVSVGRSPLAEPVRVSAGTRRLSAAMSGKRRVTQLVEAAGGETVSVRLELDLDHDARLADTPAPSAATEASGPGATLWLGIATGALAVGAGVMGTLAAIDGSKFHDALHRSASAHEIDSLHDRAQVKAITTDILLGATAVTGIVTLVVALGSHGEERAPSAASEARHTQVSLGLGTLQLTSHFE